ncbi:hypothetical protein CPB83DRAFT_587497 [Crepidotus variabilis]|uniref:F-box domain-containing protein n=1 Tax=Crepidotus variabilis TaxID=179855 RepID=A0A9P6EPC3_9AGAR|nr:hypothetical protein CPB83DRAFT_587497 [Crepidotus variabilis]
MSTTCPLCVYHLEHLDKSEKETCVSPGASECQHSRSQPCDLCCRFAEGEQRIQEAKAALLRALDDQRELGSELNERNDLLLGKLPVELACRIFQLSVPPSLTLAEFREQLTVNSKLNFTSPKGLLKLGAICRSWRRVAWSHPQLWSDIFICSTPKIMSPSHITFIEEWIHRSGELPLNIFTELKDQFTENTYLINTLINTLGTVAHRWALFYAFSSLPAVYGEQLALQFRRATNVQGFALQTANQWGRDAWGVGFAGRGDNLKFLYLSGHQQDVTLKCRNLTHFVGEYRTIGECVNVLRNAPQILDCTIKSTLDHDDRPASLIHSIKSLNLCGSPDILQYLELPSLTGLVLSELPKSDSFSDVVLPFIVRSGCQLEAFTISRQTDIIDDYSEFFRLNPSLKYLELQPHYDCEWALSRLGELLSPHVNSSDQILPNLRSLTYVWTEIPSHIPWPTIHAVVQPMSSQPNVVWRPLTEIHFVMGRMLKKPEEFLHLDDLERIQELASQGINFRISAAKPAIDVIQACREYQRRLQESGE